MGVEKSNNFAKKRKKLNRLPDKIKIGVIIATSMARTEQLFNVSLKSVLLQTVLPDAIIVVDDNNDEYISHAVEDEIKAINRDIVGYIRNTHTKNMSGTGAWNTGIELIAERLGKECYVAILDDDDSWDIEYIETLYKAIAENQESLAFFPFIKRTDCQQVMRFSSKDLTVNNFLVGDPGVQGSNMCFKVNALTEIDGFDETLASCTDRDLMIRFLQEFGNDRIFVIEKKFVNHFASNNTVTASFEKKRNGLNAFYRKYIALFDDETLGMSLARSERLFQFPDAKTINDIYIESKRKAMEKQEEMQFYEDVENQDIVIGVAMKDGAATIRRCLVSILEQEGLKRNLKVVLANDDSVDEWQTRIADLLQDKRVTLLNLHNGNVVKTRNEINRYIQQNYPHCVLIGRLDADDEYSSKYELAKVECAFEREIPDIISAGNYLREDGVILERKNPTTKKLKEIDYVLYRLKQMSEGVLEGELPSCNLFIRPQALLPYPQMESGEDHALFVQYLINQEKYNVFFAENLVPVIYNVSGNMTASNIKLGKQIKSRQELYLNTLSLCKRMKENKKP